MVENLIPLFFIVTLLLLQLSGLKTSFEVESDASHGTGHRSVAPYLCLFCRAATCFCYGLDFGDVVLSMSALPGLVTTVYICYVFERNRLILPPLVDVHWISYGLALVLVAVNVACLTLIPRPISWDLEAALLVSVFAAELAAQMRMCAVAYTYKSSALMPELFLVAFALHSVAGVVYGAAVQGNPLLTALYGVSLAVVAASLAVRFYFKHPSQLLQDGDRFGGAGAGGGGLDKSGFGGMVDDSDFVVRDDTGGAPVKKVIIGTAAFGSGGGGGTSGGGAAAGARGGASGGEGGGYAGGKYYYSSPDAAANANNNSSSSGNGSYAGGSGGGSGGGASSTLPRSRGSQQQQQQQHDGGGGGGQQYLGGGGVGAYATAAAAMLAGGGGGGGVPRRLTNDKLSSRLLASNEDYAIDTDDDLDLGEDAAVHAPMMGSSSSSSFSPHGGASGLMLPPSL